VADALFLGLDVGTSGVKALLVTEAGEVEATATTPLTLSTPRPGWAEQHPHTWWDASLASDNCSPPPSPRGAYGLWASRDRCTPRSFSTGPRR